MPIPARRLAALILSVTIAAGLVAGCGGDEESDSESDAPATTAQETTTAAAAALDAPALEDCLLASALDRGVYEKIRDPSSIVVDAASASGAELFELSKADEGLVYYFAYPDAETAEAELATVESAMGELQGLLAADAPKGFSLGAPETDVVDSLTVASISFDGTEATQLQADALADVANCLEEIAAG
jgi:hypothetical protein